MDQYELLRTVGEGTYGVVWKCRDRETGQIVAIKRFKEVESNDYARCAMLRELRVEQLLCGEPHVVQLLAAFKEKNRPHLVMEYLPRNLLDVIDMHPNGLALEDISVLMYTLLLGVRSCHSNGIVHRDIKPENILVRDDGTATLCDFGFSRPVSSVSGGPPYRSEGAGEASEATPSDALALKNFNQLLSDLVLGKGDGIMTDYVATRWYRSPEMLLGMTNYDFAVDMWAVGAIMSEALDGQPLLPGRTEIEQLALIHERIGEFPPCYQSYLLARSRGMIHVRGRRGSAQIPLSSSSASPKNEDHPKGGVTSSKKHRSYLKKRFGRQIGELGLDLLQRLLALEAKQRITVEEALQHPFFTTAAQKYRQLKLAAACPHIAMEGSASSTSPTCSSASSEERGTFQTPKRHPKGKYYASCHATERTSSRESSCSENASVVPVNALPILIEEKDTGSLLGSTGYVAESKTGGTTCADCSNSLSGALCSATAYPPTGSGCDPKLMLNGVNATPSPSLAGTNDAHSGFSSGLSNLQATSHLTVPRLEMLHTVQVRSGRYGGHPVHSPPSSTHCKITRVSEKEKPVLLREIESLNHAVPPPSLLEVLLPMPVEKSARPNVSSSARKKSVPSQSKKADLTPRIAQRKPGQRKEPAMSSPSRRHGRQRRYSGNTKETNAADTPLGRRGESPGKLQTGGCTPVAENVVEVSSPIQPPPTVGVGTSPLQDCSETPTHKTQKPSLYFRPKRCGPLLHLLASSEDAQLSSGCTLPSVTRVSPCCLLSHARHASVTDGSVAMLSFEGNSLPSGKLGATEDAPFACDRVPTVAVSSSGDCMHSPTIPGVVSQQPKNGNGCCNLVASLVDVAAGDHDTSAMATSRRSSAKVGTNGEGNMATVQPGNSDRMIPRSRSFDLHAKDDPLFGKETTEVPRPLIEVPTSLSRQSTLPLPPVHESGVNLELLRKAQLLHSGPRKKGRLVLRDR